MIEILIRDRVPEWAGEIDFSTLRREPGELVSKRTLQLRHPDMIWSAGATGGRRVMFLIEFQRTAERLMALRTTTYAALTLEGIAAKADFRPGDPLPELVYLVLYHGDRPWRAPDHVTGLFERSDPAGFRLVSWRDEDETGRTRDDITALVLGLARNLSPEDVGAGVETLRRKVEERGPARLDEFLAGRVRRMLESRGYTETPKLGGAKTMAEMVNRFQQGLDELYRRGAREGRRDGRAEGRREGRAEGHREGRVQGRALALRRVIARRFGEETAGRVSEVLEGLRGPEAIDGVTDALFECGTGEEFVERVRTA